jgi:hypothetical protein
MYDDPLLGDPRRDGGCGVTEHFFVNGQVNGITNGDFSAVAFARRAAMRFDGGHFPR